MILLYKILNNYFSSDFSVLYIPTQILLPLEDTSLNYLSSYHSRLNCRSNYFFNKLINDWNNLPAFVVNANSVNCFKSLIDNYFLDSRFSFV